MFSKFASGALAALAFVAISNSASAAINLTNGTLFRADETGTNQNTTNGGTTVSRGGWTTVLGQQNIAGNYGAQLFLATTADPAAGDFFAPATSVSAGLQEGANTFYFWADGDDTQGGDKGFGLNLWFDGAAASQVAISAFAPTPGASFAANGSTGCTAAYSLACIAGSGTLSFVVGASTVTLTDFRIQGLGGGQGGEDRVYHDNVNGFTPPAHSNGVNDTYGYFVLNVTTSDTAPVPEPTSWALMIAGFGLAGTALRTRRRALA